MPGRTPMVTGALLIATVATAAGLNMAVMGLASSNATASEESGSAPTPIAEAVALTSAEVAPMGAATATPVPAVGAPAQAATASSTAASTDPTTAPTASQSDHSTSSSPATTVSTASSPTSAPAVDPTTTAPAASSTTAPTTTVSTEYVTYAFEGVASIVVAVHDGDELEFWSVTAEDGWVFLVEDRGPDKVKIKFRPSGGGDEAEFELEFEDGRLEAKREY